MYFTAQMVLTTPAGGRYDDVVRLQESLCDVKRQFQELQLKEVEKDQMRQSSLYRAAQKVRVCVCVCLRRKYRQKGSCVFQSDDFKHLKPRRGSKCYFAEQ